MNPKFGAGDIITIETAHQFSIPLNWLNLEKLDPNTDISVGVGNDKFDGTVNEYYLYKQLTNDDSSPSGIDQFKTVFESLSKNVQKLVLNHYNDKANKINKIQIYYLGVCYQNGLVVDRNLPGAIDLFKQAVALGNADAMNNLGVCYQNGQWVTKDLSQAIKWFEQAVELGHAHAMNNLAGYYRNELGVTKDLSQAIKLYERAVELGNAHAMNNLGGCYQNGLGVDRNLPGAIDLFKRAVELGHAHAMNNLGVCYRNGQGVDKNNFAEHINFVISYHQGGNAASRLYNSLKLLHSTIIESNPEFSSVTFNGFFNKFIHKWDEAKKKLKLKDYANYTNCTSGTVCPMSLETLKDTDEVIVFNNGNIISGVFTAAHLFDWWSKTVEINGVKASVMLTALNPLNKNNTDTFLE